MSTCVFVACCLHSLVTETFRRRALTASVDSYKEFPFSGVTNSDSLDEGGGKAMPGVWHRHPRSLWEPSRRWMEETHNAGRHCHSSRVAAAELGIMLLQSIIHTK